MMYLQDLSSSSLESPTNKYSNDPGGHSDWEGATQKTYCYLKDILSQFVNLASNRVNILHEINSNSTWKFINLEDKKLSFWGFYLCSGVDLLVLGTVPLKVLLMDKILHQVRLVVYPIICKVLYIPGGAGFRPSTVFLTKLSILRDWTEAGSIHHFRPMEDKSLHSHTS